MAQAKHPKLAVRAVRKGRAAGVAGGRRRRTRKARTGAARRDRAPRPRIQGHDGDHEAARRPAAAAEKRGQARARPPPKGGSFAPLQIFAEGDSWFDYPVPFFGGGIIPRLENRLGVPILNLAKAGDEVRYMLGVEERKLLIEHFTNGCPAGGPWDVLLFSGGGNDIVDNPMALWVKDWNPAMPPADHIHQPRFDAALALVRAGYEDLIALRDKLSPTTHLVFHGYDFAIPDGRGICYLARGSSRPSTCANSRRARRHRRSYKAMLQQFAAMLTSLPLSRR